MIKTWNEVDVRRAGSRESTYYNKHIDVKVVEFTEDVIYISYPLNEETQRSAFTKRYKIACYVLNGYDPKMYIPFQL